MDWRANTNVFVHILRNSGDRFNLSYLKVLVYKRLIIMSKIVRRRYLREKDVKSLLSDLSKRFKVDPKILFGVKPHVEMTETRDIEIIIINSKPLLARLEGSLLPTLKFEAFFPYLPKIVVDMGAVPHICNGANVMAPGVVRIDGDFRKNDFLLIVDERYERSLGIGIALFDFQLIGDRKKGEIVKNVHFIGDKLWNLMKSLS